MSTLTISEAQAQLPELIDSLLPGQELAIMQNEKLVAKLVIPHQPLPKPIPVFGSCKGMITIHADDDEHLEHFKEYMP
jgi:antitoxin (DNA-binding transcriptional repressor) of toxin-antitoxin stability system